MITCSLIIAWFVGLSNFGSNEAQGTDVSGTISPPGVTWDLAGSPYIVVDDVWVDEGATLTVEPGVSVKFDGFFGIYVQGNLTAIGTESNRIDFTSNQATPAPGDWDTLYINGHAEIRYCNITYGNGGLYLGASSNNNVTDNNISYHSDYGFSLGGTFNTVNNNTMIENGIFMAGAALENWNTHEIDTSNTVNGKPVYYWKNKKGGTIPADAGAVILANCTDITVENLELAGGAYGIQLGYSSHNGIFNNSITSHRFGMGLGSSNYNQVANNNINNNFHGISVGGSQYNNIDNNTVCSHYANGMIISGSDDNNITGNNISDNGGHGIELKSVSERNNIIGNTFLSNDNSGVRVHPWSVGNIISRNTIFDSNRGVATLGNTNKIIGNGISYSDYGIYVEAGESDISNNTVINNDYGIYITGKANNNIYHNNIINNTNQAYDDTIFGNRWDNGYPYGGNYWSDYDGFDNYSGPGQFEPGPDGIGDTPYYI
ncbi:MAG: right-handed parallel beta-helix repeat-containing protein, partial [Thermoplasmata archaeon]